jgi:hypothetical protein
MESGYRLAIVLSLLLEGIAALLLSLPRHPGASAPPRRPARPHSPVAGPRRSSLTRSPPIPPARSLTLRPPRSRWAQPSRDTPPTQPCNHLGSV